MMFTGLPNLIWVFGYFRASWTLRADLIAGYVCRLLQHMDSKGVQTVIPTLRPEDEDMELLPWVDPENFNPGYLMRSIHLMPKQGTVDPGNTLKTIGEIKTSYLLSSWMMEPCSTSKTVQFR